MLVIQFPTVVYQCACICVCVCVASSVKLIHLSLVTGKDGAVIAISSCPAVFLVIPILLFICNMMHHPYFYCLLGTATPASSSHCHCGEGDAGKNSLGGCMSQYINTCYSFPFNVSTICPSFVS